mmetsp:Transcript_81919/g.237561  ORF Transcript_81919/g.237561 Transcript_81919/m.237561 type:complete len:127 (+) Transcript_81919:71-451(+)
MGAQASTAGAETQCQAVGNTAQGTASEQPRLLGGVQPACRAPSKASEVSKMTMTSTSSAASKGSAGSKNSKSFMRDMVSTLSDPAARRSCAQAHSGFKNPYAEAEKAPLSSNKKKQLVSPSTLGRF